MITPIFFLFANKVPQLGDYFTYDVMSRIVYGTSYDLLTKADDHWVLSDIIGNQERVAFLMHIPELEDLKLNHIMFPEARFKAKRFAMKSKAIMEERKAREGDKAGKGGNDLFSRLLNAKDPETGEGLSHAQLWVESNLLIIAGKSCFLRVQT
jgi:cytochrome P450